MGDGPVGDGPIEVRAHTGDREEVRWSFQLAEDSRAQLDAYLDLGEVLVAVEGDRIVGHLQLVPTGPTEAEVKNMAVAPDHRGRGVGRVLLDAAVNRARGAGCGRLTVATGAADTGNLRFYQRCGFRLLGVERDAFIPATGYPTPIVIDGIELRDRVWLDREL